MIDKEYAKVTKESIKVLNDASESYINILLHLIRDTHDDTFIQCQYVALNEILHSIVGKIILRSEKDLKYVDKSEEKIKKAITDAIMKLNNINNNI
jgi:hypothetical protein